MSSYRYRCFTRSFTKEIPFEIKNFDVKNYGFYDQSLHLRWFQGRARHEKQKKNKQMMKEDGEGGKGMMKVNH